MTGTECPSGRGICPVCKGEKEVHLTEKELAQSWNKNRKTKPCRNCGGQYQFGSPSGTVPLNKEGTPCEHSYQGKSTRWRCVTEYICQHCNDSYKIDSGD